MNKNVYNQYSEDYGKLFIENVKGFLDKLEKTKEGKSYTAFYPSFGTRNKNADFLIYGQAVKGWGTEFKKNDTIDYTILLQEAIEFSNSFFRGEDVEHSPLDWVNVYWSNSSFRNAMENTASKSFYEDIPYRVSRSFFWNVVYKLICRYYKLEMESWDWSKKMVWSNLYKIAPSAFANPGDYECELQVAISIELVRKEIEELNPKYCIVLTNLEWWIPFRMGLKTHDIQESKNEIIQSVEKYKNTQIIVTSRPFAGNSKTHVDAILKEMNSTS